jgi:hypothetical protein
MSSYGATMSDVTLLKLILELAAILGAVRIMHFFRARAMRRLASKWGFRYIGPAAPPQWWWNTSQPLIPAPLPGWASQLGVSQAWNIIEGTSNGTSVFVFDAVLGGMRSRPYTYIACHGEQSPFPMTTSAEPVVQMRGWWVLGGVKFLGFFCWFMGTRRLDRHLDYLRE